MEYTMKCGCSVWVPGDSLPAHIEYCPKHKSAPELYEALKLIKLHLDGEILLLGDDTITANDYKRVVEQALSKAGGK